MNNCLSRDCVIQEIINTLTSPPPKKDDKLEIQIKRVWKSRWGEGSRKFGNPGGEGVKKFCHPWEGVDIYSEITHYGCEQ